MCNIPIKVSAHTFLNSSKGVIRSRDLEGVSEDEMLDNLSSQGVSAVKRIQILRNNELVPTNTFILTFSKPLLPDSIKAGYLKIPVVPFIPNPLQCFKCHRYGHRKNTCRGKVTCARCSQVDHESKTCNNAISCANCRAATLLDPFIHPKDGSSTSVWAPSVYLTHSYILKKDPPPQCEPCQCTWPIHTS